MKDPRNKKMKKAYKFLIAASVTAIITAVTMLLINAAAPDTTDKNVIKSILINKDFTAIEVKGSLTSDYVNSHKNDSIYLFEIMPDGSASRLYETKPVTSIKATADFTYKIEFNKNEKTKLFAKYLVADKNSDGTYNIITNAHFIDNPESMAAETYPYPVYTTKKGLEIQMETDAQELGVSHTVVNVPVNEYLMTESTTDAEPFVFDNQNFYINKMKLAQLDHKIKVYSEAGIEVFLNIILTSWNNNASDKLRCLYNGDVYENSKLYAFNTQNKDSVFYMEGFFTFLAERYTRSDKQYGFAGSYIFGYEVNSNRTWNNMGPMPLDNYLNSYTTAFRIADTALRSVYLNGKIYLPLANNFNRQTNFENIIADPKLDYSGRELLEMFNEKITASGNIPWNAAINAYPSDTNSSEAWKDDAAWKSDDTPYINISNIEVLCDFLKQDIFSYRGHTRTILISECGATSNTDESSQAASIAYAYYKASAYLMIDAIIFHRHVDFVGENGANYGLWTSLQDDINSPFSKKNAYSVFKYMDTDRSLTTTSFSLQRMGIKDWKEIIPGFNEANIIKRNVYETEPASAEDNLKKYSQKTPFDFSAGDKYDFYPSDNAQYIELRLDPDTETAALYGRMSSRFPGDYMGISRVMSKDQSLKNVKYIKLKVKAEAPEGVGMLNLMFRLYNKGGEYNSAVYESVTQIEAGKWKEVVFRTENYTSIYSNADVMKIWLKPSDGKQYEGSYGIWVGSITTYSKNILGIFKYILWIILAVIIAIVIFFVYIIIRNNIHARKIKRRRALKAKMQRDRAMRQQQPPPQNNNMPNRQQFPPDNNDQRKR